MFRIKYLIVLLIFTLCLGETCGKRRIFAKKKKKNLAENSRLQQLLEPEESDMTVPEIIRNRGYVAEVHYVTTDDGYILQLHRIPHGRNYDSASRRKPILLVHGIFDSSAAWVMRSTHGALAFLLADRGYDVWLGNMRGTTYSTNHTTLSTKSKEYWLFTYDEMGMYDIPAFINYILQQTGYDKLTYIGHSMGTTAFWIAMMSHPQLSDKIEVMIGLGPVAIMAHLKSPVRYFSSFVDRVVARIPVFQKRAFLPNEGLFGKYRRTICKGVLRDILMCQNFYFIMFGSDPRNFNTSLIPVLNGHVPAGTSIYTFGHYAQSYEIGEIFQKYDWGRRRNLQLYNQTTPPQYDLSQVKVPVYLFWGQNDLIASPEDVEWLANRLGNLKASYRVDFDDFNHMDFLWAIQGKELVYDRMFPLLPDPSA